MFVLGFIFFWLMFGWVFELVDISLDPRRK